MALSSSPASRPASVRSHPSVSPTVATSLRPYWANRLAASPVVITVAVGHSPAKDAVSGLVQKPPQQTAPWWRAPSRHQHRRPLKPSGAQIGEGFVCLPQGINRRFRHQTHARYLAEEVETVLPREVRDRDKLPFFP